MVSSSNLWRHWPHKRNPLAPQDPVAQYQEMLTLHIFEMECTVSTKPKAGLASSVAYTDVLMARWALDRRMSWAME